MKTALVTGSSRGIGKAIALRLAKDGYKVIVHGVRESEKLIKTAKEIEALGGGKGSALGTGGMATKLGAAKLCISKGTDMVIANGSNPSVLYDIVDGKKIGTRFKAKKD